MGRYRYDKKRSRKCVCQVCHKYADTQIHHIFPGIHRRRSDENDFVMEVCPSCHNDLHQHPLKMLPYQIECQRKYEKKNGHEAWMELMGKSWITEDER